MNFCYNCGHQLPLGREKFCPNCGVKFENTRLSGKSDNGGSSIIIDGSKGDNIGIGTSGTGNFIGREIEYTVQGNVFNLQLTGASSKEVIENLSKIMSVQTQLPSAATIKEEIKKDVAKLAELNETQQKITNVLQDVKKIEEKEGTQIQEIKVGNLRVFTKELFVKNALTRATVLYYTHQYDDALEWYEKVIVLDAKKADVWYNKGVILGKLGKYKEAIKCFDRAIEIKPEYAEAWYNKGVILGKLRKYKQAIKCYDKVKTIGMFVE